MEMMRLRPTSLAPLIGKELRTVVRSWGLPVLITPYMGIFGVVALAFLSRQAHPTSGQASPIGVSLFQILAALQLLLLVVITPSSLAGAISGERQRKTWDLLVGTPVTASGIVLSKLTAGIGLNLVLLCASLPIFSLAFLFGGFSVRAVFRVYAVFLATVFLLAAVSLLASAVTRREATSLIVANGVTFCFVFGLAVLTLFLQQWPSLQRSGGSPPMLTPLAEVDPFVALASALPTSTGHSYLGTLGTVRDAFGLFGTRPLWEIFALVAISVGGFLIALTVLLCHSYPRWITGTSN